MNTPAQPTGHPLGSAHHTRQRQSSWRTGVVVFAIAATVDLVILGVVRLAGADMTATPSGGQTMTIGIGAILLALLVTITIGTVVLAFVARTHESRWRLMATVGLVIGVVSIAAPLTAEATIGTKVALASMHVTPALIWFAALRRPMTLRRDPNAG